MKTIDDFNLGGGRVGIRFGVEADKKDLKRCQQQIEKIFAESHDLKIDFASFKTLEENVREIESIIRRLDSDELENAVNKILWRDPQQEMVDIYPSVQKMFDNLEVQFLDGKVARGFEDIFAEVRNQPVVSGKIISAIEDSAADAKTSYDGIVKDTEQIAKNMKEARDSAADTTDAGSFSDRYNQGDGNYSDAEDVTQNFEDGSQVISEIYEKIGEIQRTIKELDNVDMFPTAGDSLAECDRLLSVISEIKDKQIYDGVLNSEEWEEEANDANADLNNLIDSIHEYKEMVVEAGSFSSTDDANSAIGDLSNRLRTALRTPFDDTEEELQTYQSLLDEIETAVKTLRNSDFSQETFGTDILKDHLNTLEYSKIELQQAIKDYDERNAPDADHTEKYAAINEYKQKLDSVRVDIEKIHEEWDSVTQSQEGIEKSSDVLEKQKKIILEHSRKLKEAGELYEEIFRKFDNHGLYGERKVFSDALDLVNKEGEFQATESQNIKDAEKQLALQNRNEALEKEKELTEAIVQSRAELLNLNKQKIEKTGDSDEDEYARQQKLLERDQKRLEIMERLVQLQKDYDALDIKESDRQQFPVDDIPKTYRTGMDMTSLDSSIRSMRGTITKRTNELKAIQRRIEEKQTETVQEALDETEKHIADGLEEVQDATPVVADTTLEEDKGKLTSHTEEVERAQDQITKQQEDVIKDVIDETVEATKESLQDVKKQKPKRQRSRKKKEQDDQISMLGVEEEIVPIADETKQTKVAADTSLPSVTENYQEVAAAADNAEQAIEETTSAVKEQGAVIAEAEQKIENLTQESKELADAQKEANTQDAEAVVQDLKVSDTVDELKKEDNIVDQVKKAFQEATKEKYEFADANVFVKDVAEETVKGLDAEKSAVQLLKEAFEQGTTAKEEFRKKNEELKKVAEDTTKQLEAEAQAAQQVRNNMNPPPNQPQNTPPNNPVNPLPPTNFKNDQTITNYIIDDNGGRQEYSQTRVSSRVGSNAYITRRENYLWDNDQSAWVPTTLQERENRARYVNESKKITERLHRAQATRNKYLADFQRKTQNNQNVFGADYNAVVNAPLRQDNAADDITNLLNLMDALDTRYNTIVSNFQRGTSTLNPFVNAVAGATTLENKITSIELSLRDLDNPDQQLQDDATLLRSVYESFNSIDFADPNFNIDAYSRSFGVLREETNRIAQAVAEAKKLEKQTYGRSQYRSSERKYDQTMGQIADLGIDASDLTAVTAYTDAMAALRNEYNRIRTIQNPTDYDRVLFNALVQGAANAQKSVQAIISEEQNLLQQTRALNLEPLDLNVDTSDTQALENALNSWLAEGGYSIATMGAYNDATDTMSISVRDAEGNIHNLTLAMSKNTDVFYASEEQTKRNANIFDMMGTSIMQAGKKLAGMIGMRIGIDEFFQQFRKGVDYVKQIDLALTELKKVTDETSETYDKFLDKAATTGRSIGSTVSDFTQATADFARLGHTLEDSSTLAEAAVVYKNVGDGISDISTASESIISVMQAFGVEAKDSMSIVDKFNELGNTMPISSTGIGEALLRSASALKEGGNTLDESMGLVVAANATVQDPNRVGKIFAQQYSNVLQADRYIG